MEVLTPNEIDEILRNKMDENFTPSKPIPITKDNYWQTKTKSVEQCMSLSPQSSGYIEDMSSPASNTSLEQPEINERKPYKTIICQPSEFQQPKWKKIYVCKDKEKYFQKIFDDELSPKLILVNSGMAKKAKVVTTRTELGKKMVTKSVTGKRKETNRKASAAYRERQKTLRETLEKEQEDRFKERDRLRLRRREINTRSDVILDQLEMHLNALMG